MRFDRFLAALAAVAAPAAAQNPITRVSIRSDGTEGGADSGSLSRPAISADGRFVAFESTASNLVASDFNGSADVFVHDRVTGATVRVSVRSNGAEANGYSSSPSISDDGRFVAFESVATNLVSSDTNGAFDVFVHDRDPDGNGTFDEGNGATTRVSVSSTSVPGNFDSVTPAISGDGSKVAFSSAANNFDANDKNGVQDVFLRDRAAGTTTRLSAIPGFDSNGPSFAPAISSDGSLIAFSSLASNLLTDKNGCSDVFVSDPLAANIRRVSVDSSGIEGNDDSRRPAFSRDGSVVAFASAATNLDPSDANFVNDVFVHELATGITTRVSVDSLGIEGNGDSGAPALSNDGQIVAFESTADDFTPNDGNFSNDVFLHDRATGLTECITLNGVGVVANGFGSTGPALSSDGLVVAFSSSGDNLVVGDGNFVSDVFARDRTLVPPLAAWANYGTGFSGFLGIPSLTATADPVFGTNISIQASNSQGSPTVCLVFLGLAPDSLQTNRGGVLLVDFELILPLPMDATGLSIDSIVPADIRLYGLNVYMQVIEADFGASAGFSFTPGLVLALGL